MILWVIMYLVLLGHFILESIGNEEGERETTCNQYYSFCLFTCWMLVCWFIWHHTIFGKVFGFWQIFGGNFPSHSKVIVFSNYEPLCPESRYYIICLFAVFVFLCLNISIPHTMLHLVLQPFYWRSCCSKKHVMQNIIMSWTGQYEW